MQFFQIGHNPQNSAHLYMFSWEIGHEMTIIRVIRVKHAYLPPCQFYFDHKESSQGGEGRQQCGRLSRELVRQDAVLAGEDKGAKKIHRCVTGHSTCDTSCK